jgi:hypothetical protein
VPLGGVDPAGLCCCVLSTSPTGAVDAILGQDRLQRRGVDAIDLEYHGILRQVTTLFLPPFKGLTTRPHSSTFGICLAVTQRRRAPHDIYPPRDSCGVTTGETVCCDGGVERSSTMASQRFCRRQGPCVGKVRPDYEAPPETSNLPALQEGGFLIWQKRRTRRGRRR